MGKLREVHQNEKSLEISTFQSSFFIGIGAPPGTRTPNLRECENAVFPTVIRHTALILQLFYNSIILLLFSAYSLQACALHLACIRMLFQALRWGAFYKARSLQAPLL